MKVLTGICLFYFLVVLQQGVNIGSTLFFYKSNVEQEYMKWSLLISGLYFSFAILYFFPTFYKSIVIGLTAQTLASITNILVIVIDGLQSESSIHFHFQIIVNGVIDIFKYCIGVSLIVRVREQSYYNLSM